MSKRILFAGVVVLGLISWTASALASGSQPKVTVRKVHFTLTAKQCSRLPAGVVVRGSGVSRAVDDTSVDENGVTHFSEVVSMWGTARDNKGGRYRFDYDDAFTTVHKTTPYMGRFVDHFDL